jgi:hypothetical protein
LAGISEFLLLYRETIKGVNLERGRIKEAQLCQLLNILPNLEEVTIFNELIELVDSPSGDLPEITHKFKKLHTLTLFDSVNPDTPLYSHLFKDVTTLREAHLQRNFTMISQQRNLKKLELTVHHNLLHGTILINEFVQVTNLQIKIWNRVSEDVLRNLDGFVRTQSQVEVLSIDFWREWNEVNNTFLSHLLGLGTLRFVSIDNANSLEFFPKIRNPLVKKLHIEKLFHYPMILQDCAGLFPAISSLRLKSCYRPYKEYVDAINAWNSLEELEIHDAHDTFKLISKLHLPNLQKFEILSYEANCPLDLFQKFTSNHPKIVELKLNIDRLKQPLILKLLKSILWDFKGLKKLMLKMEFQDLEIMIDKIYNVIMENAPNLEWLVLNFGHLEIDGTVSSEQQEIKSKVQDHFAGVFPDLKFKVIFAYSENPWN